MTCKRRHRSVLQRPALHRLALQWPALRRVGATCMLALPLAAQAQAWTWQPNASARSESNTNPSLVAEPGAARTTSTVSTRLAASRNTENTETRADTELILSPSDSSPERRLLGQLALSHRLSEPRNTWSASLKTQADRSLDRPNSAADVGAGATERNVSDAQLSWSHQLSERLSSETDASYSRTRYGTLTTGSDFDLRALNAGLRYRLRETTQMGATISQTQQRAAGSSQPTTISGWRVSASESLSENSSATLSVGQSTTTRGFTQRSLVCPLQVQLCQGGLVAYVVAESSLKVRNRDLQYSVSADLRWSETTQLAMRLSRALATNALGVTRDDRLGLNVNRAFSETTTASLTYDESRSRADGVLSGAGAPTLRALGLTLAHRWDERWSVNAQLLQRHYSSATPQLRAQATVFSISLQYQGGIVSIWR